MAAPGVFQGRGAHGTSIALGDHGPEVDAMGVINAVKTRNIDHWLIVKLSHILGDEAEGFGGLRGALRVGYWFRKDRDVALR